MKKAIVGLCRYSIEKFLQKKGRKTCYNFGMKSLCRFSRATLLHLSLLALQISCMEAEKVSLDTSGAEGLLLGEISLSAGLFGGGTGSGGSPTVLVDGLIWQRCAYGQTWDGNNCTGSAQTLVNCGLDGSGAPYCGPGASITVGPAFDYCSSLLLDGYSDWRLPTNSELWQIVHCSTGWAEAMVCNPGSTSPYIDASLFPGFDGNGYLAGNLSSGFPLNVFFQTASQYYSTAPSSSYVRCVRP